MNTRAFIAAAGLAVALLGSGAASAQSVDLVESIEAGPMAAFDSSLRTPTGSAARRPFDGGAVDEQSLSAALTITTGDQSMTAANVQSSNVSNNVVSGDSVTGDVNISDNAFHNANGFMILNANTGNNVSINASINVNFMTPPSG
ncbi:MAG: hypothetical protein ACXWUR_07190 [Allosphingosinicella sp.]